MPPCAAVKHSLDIGDSISFPQLLVFPYTADPHQKGCPGTEDTGGAADMLL